MARLIALSAYLGGRIVTYYDEWVRAKVPTTEKDGRKRTIAQTFVDASVQATVYRAGPHHRNERQRRLKRL